MKNTVRKKIIHYLYEDKGDRVVFLPITVNRSDHVCDNFVCFLFLYPRSRKRREGGGELRGWRERMKRGSGMKVRVERSRGMETHDEFTRRADG